MKWPRKISPAKTKVHRPGAQSYDRLAEAWPDRSIVQQPVAQISLGHNCILADAKSPLGVAEYRLLPSDLKRLSSIQQLTNSVTASETNNEQN